MGLLSRIFGTKRPKLTQLTFSPEPFEINILNLQDYFNQAIQHVMVENITNDPISYVNENSHVTCPSCGVDYNENGFEIGYLASLAGGIDQGIQTTFSSGGDGIYPRCISGICPNQNCSSRIAIIRWLGDNGQSNLSEPEEQTLKEDIEEWKMLETNHFKITHPLNWTIENTENGFEICPPGNPSMFDEKLGREVASPGINIFVGTVPDQDLNYVTEYIKFRETEGYEEYTFVKFYLNEINNQHPEVIYEFKYGQKHNRFIAISLLKQYNGSLINITASGGIEDIEKFRKTIERIIQSFNKI